MMKNIFKVILPLIIMGIMFVSCSKNSAVAKKTYKCDQDANLTISFTKEGTASVYFNGEFKKEDGSGFEAAKNVQIAIGHYRVEGNLLVFTVGATKQISVLTVKKMPKSLNDMSQGEIYTFNIQDKGAKLISNNDVSTWAIKS